MQDNNKKTVFLKRSESKIVLFDNSNQVHWLKKNCKEWGLKMKKWKSLRVPFLWMCRLICISSPRPVTKTNETECGRVSRTMPARVHLSPYVNSTGRREAFSSYILVSLKSLHPQTWVNGLLMDIQRQVLFLLAFDIKLQGSPSGLKSSTES